VNYAASAKMEAIHAVPGKALGIWALVMSFLIPVVGLVLGIVALQQSRRAGVPNPLAIAGIVISTVYIVAAVVTTVAIWAM
jgi:hypothetical protein